MSESITPTSDPPRRTGWFILFALFFIAAMISRLCYLVRPFDSDGAMFIYMGRLISEGGRFGHDLIDNKFPTVGLMTSFPWRLFGAHWTPYVLFGAVMSISAALILARAAQRHFGKPAGVATAICAIAFLNFNFTVFGGFQLETPQALLASLAAAAALEALAGEDWRDAFAVGLCAGTAALLKPSGCAVAIAFACAATIYVSSWRATFKLALGGLAGAMIPLATALIYLLAADNLRDLPALAKQISMYAANSSWQAADFMKPIIVLVLAGFPFFVRGVIFRRQRDRADASTKPAMWMFLIGWLILEILGVAAQRRMYAYHFLVLAPPLALIFGVIPRKAKIGSLAAALAPLTIFSLYGAVLVFQNPTERPELAVSAYLNAHAAPDDKAWKDDATRLLLETGLHCGSRYPLTFLFANYDSAPLEYSGEILKDFDRSHPKYIVLRADFDSYVQHQCKYILELERFPKRRENFQIAWNRIAQYVRDHYTVETSIGHEQIWRRVDDQPAQASIAHSMTER